MTYNKYFTQCVILRNINISFRVRILNKAVYYENKSGNDKR